MCGLTVRINVFWEQENGCSYSLDTPCRIWFFRFQNMETWQTVQNQARHASRVTPNFIREIDRSDIDEFNAGLLFVLCFIFIELKTFMLPRDSLVLIRLNGPHQQCQRPTWLRSPLVRFVATIEASLARTSTGTQFYRYVVQLVITEWANHFLLFARVHFWPNKNINSLYCLVTCLCTRVLTTDYWFPDCRRIPEEKGLLKRQFQNDRANVTHGDPKFQTGLFYYYVVLVLASRT